MTTTKVENIKAKVENQHTPGPWKVDTMPYGSRPATITANGLVVAHVRTNEQDARLIAAAPIGHKLATQVMAWANACPSPIVQLASEFLQQAEGR